jgi:hypothetical protein
VKAGGSFRASRDWAFVLRVIRIDKSHFFGGSSRKHGLDVNVRAKSCTLLGLNPYASPKCSIGLQEDFVRTMKSTPFLFRFFAMSVMLTAALAQASTVTGTVSNKTSGRPAAGDVVELVDVQAGMKTTARSVTDGNGHYSLEELGAGPYLVRAMHQGAGYFIAAPAGNGPGNITVYDSSSRVNGVSIEDDVLQIESENGQLDVAEQWVIHNTSSPKVTQFSKNTFEFVLPAGAVLDGAEATRPSGLPTTAIPVPLSQKGHFTLNVPIQPDEGDNQTLFVVRYHVAYAGNFSFSPTLLMAVENFAIQMPKAMSFKQGSGVTYQQVQPPSQGTAVQTYLVKNAEPGKTLDFAVSGNGALPREDQGAQNGQQAANGQDNASGGTTGNTPGGGIGNPIGTPDPLSKYKWWLLGCLLLVLVAAAAVMLRKPTGGPVGGGAVPEVARIDISSATPAPKQSQLLNALKEEMFALESERINDTIAAEEYAKVKDALETVLKRALKRK